jgi:DNA-directed RNA polymerase specialized sigma24 family protein
MMDEESNPILVNEIARSQPIMRAYLAKLLSNSSSTDDVLQEANKVIWMKRSHWDPETPFLHPPLQGGLHSPPAPPAKGNF